MENNKKVTKVSQKAIIYNEEGKILTVRRSETAPTRPLFWDLPGGELDYGEDTHDGILREIKEETGLDVEELSVIEALSSFDPHKEFWVTICYAAKAKATKVVLSYEHDKFQWVTPDEFQELKASPKNKKFVEVFKGLGKERKG